MTDRIEPHDYLLGELSGAELREAERLLRDDPEFAAAVERLRPVVAELESVDDTVWREIPPLEPAGAPGQREPGPSRRRWWAWRPAFAGALAGAAAAAIVAIVIAGNGGGETDDGRTLTLAAIPQSGAGDARGTATLSASGETATVELAGLDPSREGEFYELWLLNDTDDLVSLGSFRVEAEGTTTVELPLPVSPDEYGFVDISVEPDDGDASHSGDSVLRGPIQAS